MSFPSFPSCHTIILDRRDRCSHAKPFSLLDSWHMTRRPSATEKEKENIPLELSTSFARAVWLPSERNQYINFIIHSPPPQSLKLQSHSPYQSFIIMKHRHSRTTPGTGGRGGEQHRIISLLMAAMSLSVIMVWISFYCVVDTMESGGECVMNCLSGIL